MVLIRRFVLFVGEAEFTFGAGEVEGEIFPGVG